MKNKKLIYKEIYKKILKLENYIEKNDYKGYDPYDALNFKNTSVPFIDKSKVLQVFFLQLLKYNPINLRKIFKLMNH